jgi:hypothetical protein
MNFSRFSTTCGIVCGCGMWLVAHASSSMEEAPDPDFPKTLSADFADQLLKNSPFTRIVDLSSTLKLTGIAYVDGQPVVTVVNTETKKSYLVGTTPNELGWRVAAVNPSSSLDRAQVKIIIGGETIPVRYSDAQLTPGKKSSLPQGIPTLAESIGHDAKGAFVRVWSYMSDEDRAKYLSRDVSPQLRLKFTDTVHDQRDTLMKASHEDRAAAVKKAFDAIIGK